MGNVVMEATQINYRRDDTLKTVDQKLQELSQESAIDTDIAPVFKSTDTYHAGDLVYYRNKLYVFNVDHTGAWAAADVTATNVSAAMTAALAGKADYADIAGAFSAETSYTAGDLVIYNGIIYRCTNDHTGDWDADDFSATTIGAELDAINSNISTLESGLTNLQNDVNGKHLYYQDSFSINTSVAYGSLYRTYSLPIDISSLGISNVNDIKSINISSANADRAFVIMTDYSATKVNIMFLSDTQLTGSATKLFIDIVTN